MLKALGLAKKKPVTPEQRQKHAEQSTLQAKWKHDADTICGITAQLRDKYGAHKGDFALGRYEQLKTMIKDAIRLFKETDESSRRHVSRRYLADAAGGKTGGGGGVGGNGSALTRLTKSAREYAAHQPASKSAEDMSSKEIDTEVERLRKETLALKQTYRAERDKMTKLASEYEKSKNLSPPQRYSALKELIKQTTIQI